MSPGSQGGQEWIYDPLELYHTWLGAVMWVLEIELGSPGRAACALSPCKTSGISPVLSNHFLSIYLFVVVPLCYSQLCKLPSAVSADNAETHLVTL